MVFDELASIATQPYEYVPDVSLGSRSPYMDHARFQKGLTLVCKSWWEPATRILYERIVIRHMYQIDALARTLSATDAGFDFSSLIQHITLHECSILKPFSDVVLEHLRLILQRCTNLQSFGMVPHDAIDYSDNGPWHAPGSALDTSWMALGTIRGVLPGERAANLRHLELPVEEHSLTAIVDLYHLLSSTPQLGSLKLERFKLTKEHERFDEWKAPQGLTLPALSDLSLTMQDYNLYGWIASAWQLPNLTSLTLLGYDGVIPSTFLAAHGKRLTYLHCYPYAGRYHDSWHSEFEYGLDELAAAAPMIEHLVVCKAASDVLRKLNAAEEPLLHLRHLDVWVPHMPGLTRQRVLDESFKEYDEATEGNHEKFPALGENVRFLSHRVHGHSDLPKICHPSALSTDDEVRTLCVRDVSIVQTSWCIVPVIEHVKRLGDEPNVDSDEDADEDPDFVADDDDEDRTSRVSEDASDSGSDAGTLDSGDDDGDAALSQETVTYTNWPHRPDAHVHHALLEQWDSEEVDRARRYLASEGQQWSASGW